MFLFSGRVLFDFDNLFVRRKSFYYNYLIGRKYFFLNEQNLWQKDQTQCYGCASEHKQCDEHERGDFVVNNERNDRAGRTHDQHVVDADAYVLRVVECRDRHVSGLVGEEASEKLD